MNNSSLHEAIIACFLDRQRPPTIRELASRFGCDEASTRPVLRALAQNHGVVLHPGTDEIWVMLPVEQVWAFAAEWYARHADANWTKWSAREAAEIFRRHNLTGPIWSLPNDTGRF